MLIPWAIAPEDLEIASITEERKVGLCSAEHAWVGGIYALLQSIPSYSFFKVGQSSFKTVIDVMCVLMLSCSAVFDSLWPYEL